ncbi:MAG TPA: hypothetical protein VK638_19690 [Edaphobacter sp.]|nr:hypothetical protein [Edaphobacter sp.]
MGIKDDIDAVRATSDTLTLEQKMVLVISVAFNLAAKMATIRGDEEGAATMREALGTFFQVFAVAFPEGPFEAQEAVQEFSKKIGVIPEEMWKVRPN